MNLDADKVSEAREAARQFLILSSLLHSLFKLLREAHQNSPEQKARYHKKLLRDIAGGYDKGSIPTNPDVVAASEHARRYWKRF
jgi:hypothetical protein